VAEYPLAYFITFTTYGTWLHGDQRGSILQSANGTHLLKPSPELHNHERQKLRYPIVTFNKKQRSIVLETIKKHCKLKEWKLYAVHVQSNHIHVIVAAKEKPEKIMSDLKAWSTRMLREQGYEIQKAWTRHGSTKYVYSYEKLNEKIKYVVCGQGEKMEYYLARS